MDQPPFIFSFSGSLNFFSCFFFCIAADKITALRFAHALTLSRSFSRYRTYHVARCWWCSTSEERERRALNGSDLFIAKLKYSVELSPCCCFIEILPCHLLLRDWVSHLILGHSCHLSLALLNVQVLNANCKVLFLFSASLSCLYFSATCIC